MVVRLKEWIIPYTAWDWIDISDNHVISVLLREANNLIHINEDREMYVDLQLDDGIAPTDDFPVGVTTGRILAEDWRPQNGIILNWKTTSGDYVRLIYAQDWKLYYDPGTWTWTELGAWGGGTCDCNVKLFTLSGATDLTTAQAILDWQKQGKDAIVAYDNEIFMFKTYRVITQTPAVWLSYNHIVRDRVSQGYSETYAKAIEINYDPANSNTVSSISITTYRTTPCSIDPDTQYNSAFMPTLGYQPATKAYVDQMVSWVYIYKGSVSTYTDLANIQNPEVWDVYNVVDSGMNYAWTGTAWDALWGTINYTAWDWIWINNWVISNTKPGATVSSTAPSNPSEWDLWYDTTNDVLKSYDGTSWNECGGDWSNVKAFFLSSTSDLTNAQAAYDWYAAGKEPMLIYSNKAYTYDWLHNWGPSIRFLTNRLDLTTMSNSTAIAQPSITLEVTSSTVTAISEASYTRGYVLVTWVDYQSAYTPTYNWSPTSKKYVDDWDTYIGSSAPSTPYEWQLWYDTTNDKLKVYDGSQWNEIWSWWGWWTGDVVWPSSAVDWHLAVFDGTTGKLIKDWGAIPSYGAATSSTAWLVKLGSDTQQSVSANSPSSTNGRTYPVQTNSSWQMVVNVPWTDSWGGWGWSYTAWDWINITNSVISNTMYPTNASTGQTWDILMKSANGTEWLTTDWIYSNVKCWEIWSSPASSTLEAIVQWVNKGSNYGAVLKSSTQNAYVYGWSTTSGSTTTYYFPSLMNTTDASTNTTTGYTTLYNDVYKITVSWTTYTGAFDHRNNIGNFIEATGKAYSTYFTPTQDYHPATKKYVDDAVAWGWGGGWITNNTTGTTSTVTQVWAGTETEFNNLWTKSASVLYFVIES